MYFAICHRQSISLFSTFNRESFRKIIGSGKWNSDFVIIDRWENSAKQILCCLCLAHLSRRLIGELLVYKGIRRPSVVRPSSVRPSVRQHFQTTSPLKPRSRFFSYFTYSIYRSGERIIAFFVPVG